MIKKCWKDPIVVDLESDDFKECEVATLSFDEEILLPRAVFPSNEVPTISSFTNDNND